MLVVLGPARGGRREPYVRASTPGETRRRREQSPLAGGWGGGGGSEEQEELRQSQALPPLQQRPRPLGERLERPQASRRRSAPQAQTCRAANRSFLEHRCQGCGQTGLRNKKTQLKAFFPFPHKAPDLPCHPYAKEFSRTISALPPKLPDFAKVTHESLQISHTQSASPGPSPGGPQAEPVSTVPPCPRSTCGNPLLPSHLPSPEAPPLLCSPKPVLVLLPRLWPLGFSAGSPG